MMSVDLRTPFCPLRTFISHSFSSFITTHVRKMFFPTFCLWMARLVVVEAFLGLFPATLPFHLWAATWRKREDFHSSACERVESWKIWHFYNDILVIHIKEHIVVLLRQRKIECYDTARYVSRGDAKYPSTGSKTLCLPDVTVLASLSLMAIWKVEQLPTPLQIIGGHCCVPRPIVSLKMAEKLLMMKVVTNQTMPHGFFCFKNSPFNMSQMHRFKHNSTKL